MSVTTSVKDQIGFINFTNPPLHFMTADVLDGIYRSLHELLMDEQVKVIVLRNPAKGFFITHYSLEEIAALADVHSALKKVGFNINKFPALSMRLVKWFYRGSQQPLIGRLVHSIATLFHVERAFAYVVANDLINDVTTAPKPVIAMIGGNAQGYGMELSLACDFRIMAQGDYFMGQIESLVGLIPGAGGMHHLTNIVGPAKARELSMLGTRLDAKTAQEYGLVNKAVKEEQLENETIKLAQQLCKRSSFSLSHIKQSIRKGLRLPLKKALLNDEIGFLQTTLSKEARIMNELYLSHLSGGKSVNRSFDNLQE